MLFVVSFGIGVTALADSIHIERLTWAGVKLATEAATVFVDPVGTDLWDGEAPGGLVPVTADTTRRYALITHMHNDHFDVATLSAVLGERGYVVCHEDDAAYVASRGLRVIPAKLYVPVARGGFTFTALPAVDGTGDPQVSWLITNANRKFIHAGDTLWHGKWRQFGRQFGPIDVAFLPVNGARVLDDPPAESSIVMTPAQAVDAALLLRAGAVVPIHYGLNDPPYYVEVPEPLKATQREAQRRSVTLHALQPGDTLDLPM